MKKYYEATIIQFNDNNIPYLKKVICIKTNRKPLKGEFFNQDNKEKFGNVQEIPEGEALEIYGNRILCK